MSIIGMGAHPRVQAGEKGGIKGTKTEGTNGTGNIQARDRDCCRRTSQRLKSTRKIILSGEIKN